MTHKAHDSSNNQRTPTPKLERGSLAFLPLSSLRAAALIPLLLIVAPETTNAASAQGLEACNVEFTEFAKDSQGSMPLGNGDIGLNVWTEENGDLVFYISKTDAWLDNKAMDLVKVGRVRVALFPSPFAGGGRFAQTLRLREGEIVVEGDGGDLRVWVDANAPIIRIETSTKSPVTTTVTLDPWRADIGGNPFYTDATPDVVCPNENNRLLWYHRNENPKAWPMRDLTFGGWISGHGLVGGEGQTLRSQETSTHSRVEVVVLAEKTKTADEWIARIGELAAEQAAINPEQALAAHRAWWNDFWNRSWINVTGDEDARQVTRGYALQRFITACAGRGRFPIKFNGSIFVTDNPDSTTHQNGVKVPAPMSADERLWGGQYWVQNTRAMYWPRLAAGDFDLMRPLFRMYSDVIRENEKAVKQFYNHGGSYIAECAPYWGGIPNLRPEMPGTHTIHYFSPALELIAMGFEYHACTQDEAFLRETVLPMAHLTLTFYAQHFPRDSEGRLSIAGANSAEAFWKVTNPLPDIAGLHWVLDRLLELPHDLAGEPERSAWKQLRDELPPLPVGKREGKRSLIAYEAWSPSSEQHTPENPELYAVYPFRHFGVGKPDLQLALDTFATRRHKGSGCWRQDGPQSALLGLGDEARTHVVTNFTATEPARAFPGFWKHGLDYAPDQDNGGNGELALQWMLMQCEGKTIRLLPAWPAGWDADFKLRAPFNTTVEATVRNGKMTNLKIEPKSRAADVVVGS
jgi:hypothetical protein